MRMEDIVIGNKIQHLKPNGQYVVSTIVQGPTIIDDEVFFISETDLQHPISHKCVEGKCPNIILLND